MERTYLHDEIYYIENFLSPEELSVLEAEARADNWGDRNATRDLNLKSNWEGNIKSIKDLNLYKKINERIFNECIKEKGNLKLTLSAVIKRYNEGQTDNFQTQDKYVLMPHHDALKDPWQIGCILYINDDYEGGEVEYPNLGIEVKPKKGTLLIHGVTNDCVHGVKKVTKGTRYMITLFAGDPTNELLKDKDLDRENRKTRAPLFRIRHLFQDFELDQLISMAKDDTGWNLTGYDPKGFWDYRMKKIEPEVFREKLTKRVSQKIMTPDIVINQVTMIKVIDENCIGDNPEYSVDLHKIGQGDKKWNFLCLISLNGDYEGGEVHIPSYDNMTFKQEPNSGICIDQTMNFGIKKVTSGEKYILTIYGNRLDESTQL